MAKFEFRTIGNFDEIVGALDRAILDSALTMRLVEESLIVCRARVRPVFHAQFQPRRADADRGGGGRRGRHFRHRLRRRNRRDFQFQLWRGIEDGRRGGRRRAADGTVRKAG